VESVVRVDDRGRISIPKSIRETLGIKSRQLLKIRVVGDKIVLEPLESIADKYYGIVRVGKWPADLDEFLGESVLTLDDF